MKKIFMLLTLLLFALATLTEANTLTYFKQAPAQHMTKAASWISAITKIAPHSW